MLEDAQIYLNIWQIMVVVLLPVIKMKISNFNIYSTEHMWKGV